MEWAGSGWFIDPLDGTTNLSCDLPWFGARFSYIEEGWPVLGWVIGPAPAAAASCGREPSDDFRRAGAVLIEQNGGLLK